MACFYWHTKRCRRGGMRNKLFVIFKILYEPFAQCYWNECTVSSHTYSTYLQIIFYSIDKQFESNITIDDKCYLHKYTWWFCYIWEKMEKSNNNDHGFNDSDKKMKSKFMLWFDYSRRLPTNKKHCYSDYMPECFSSFSDVYDIHVCYTVISIISTCVYVYRHNRV